MNYKVCGNTLDKQQQEIAEDKSNHILVVAGAGSGKTLTIIGKIYNLINVEKINYKDILCISFTKASSESLKDKLFKEFKKNIEVYTFHKLSLNILKKCNKKYSISGEDTLILIIHEFLFVDVLNNTLFMKMILKYFNIKSNKKNIINKYNYFLNNNKNISIFINLIHTFLKLFKCNDYKLKDFNQFLKKIKYTLNLKSYKKKKIYLIIALNIYIKYQTYLDKNNEIDFDDMIIKTTHFLKVLNIKLNYKYIIIDEYQDTSLVRFNLVKEIINNTNSKLMVVGDDFQSIYRFTGCDLKLFLNFNHFFKDAKILKIENTYRNSQELIKIAGDFVMKNRCQIKKNLKSNKKLTKPIKIVYYKNFINAFIKIINHIYNLSKEPILILGRNNNDINMIIKSNNFNLKDNKIIYKQNKDIDMYYMTVHKSKGLEEENVIIINLIDNLLGFPSKIEDDKILKLINKSKEKIPFSEERRLFYVALTRTKNYVYLLSLKNKESIFIKELASNFKNEIEVIKYY